MAQPDNLKCSVCLDIFDKPVRIPCKHVFCQNCIDMQINVVEPKCPMCRAVFNKLLVRPANDISQKIFSTEGTCSSCSKKMVLSQLKSHSLECNKVDKTFTQFKPIALTSQTPRSDVPNRSTFQCPYCGLANLACDSFVQHCQTMHKDNAAKVVCPICASMPWGDPNRVSANFLSHLDLRHRFEYDMYVDYSRHEDEMMQAAITASLQEQ